MIKLKRANLILPILVLLPILLSFVTCQIKVNASANVLHVPVDYPTIQDAINHANTGDIIYVHEGIYYENVVVNKSVILFGENPDLTIIDGNGTGSVITISADNVTISGFTIRNSGTSIGDSGVCIGLFSGSVITNNKIMNNSNGIGLFTANNNTISNNIISGNREGIFIQASIENKVFNNTISKNTNGLGLYFYSYNNLISGNTISNNSKGIVIFNSVNNIIYHNNFINNTMDAQISSSNNIWSYKGEGNYWSRYSGRDSNQDGIGDQPYLISDRGSDICPLMGMFFGFEIILNEKKRNVNIISNSSISNYAFRIDETGSVILCFEATTEKFVSGFVRVAVPAELADNPIIVLIDNVEVQPKVLNTPDAEHLHLYISYNWGKHTIQIISSTVLGLYREIVTLNSSYQMLLEEYSALLANYSELKLELSMLNSSYSALLANYTALQQNYTKLNSDYQEHLLDYSENLQNTQNLVYILMTSTAVFLAVTVYLSRQAHVAAENKLTKSKEQF